MMNFIFKGNANKGGIYKITNTINRKIYIGSTVRFKQRWNRHISSLRNGKHKNKHLQASYNMYGENVFQFEVIEVIKSSKKYRTMREQYFIDHLIFDWKKCYNHKRKVIFSSGPWTNNPEITRLKKSENQKRLWADQTYKKMMLSKRTSFEHTEETKRKISIANKGKIRTEKQKENIRKQRINKGTKTYYFISPQNKIVVVKNLKKFCEQNGVKYDSMRHVWHGKRNSCKNWKAYR